MEGEKELPSLPGRQAFRRLKTPGVYVSIILHNVNVFRRSRASAAVPALALLLVLTISGGERTQAAAATGRACFAL